MNLDNLLKGFKRKHHSYVRAFANDEFMPNSHAIIEQLKNDEQTNEILLYDGIVLDMHQFVVPLKFKTQWQSTNFLKSYLVKFFKSFHSGEIGSEEDIIKQSLLFISNQYNRYVENVRKENRFDKERERKLTIQWADSTKVLVINTFFSVYYSLNRISKPRENVLLLKRLLWIIDCDKESYLLPWRAFDAQQGNFSEILFNLWGQDYQRKKNVIQKDSTAPTERDRALIDIEVNREYFCFSFADSFCSAIKNSKSDLESLDVEIKAMEYTESLFCDFTHRVTSRAYKLGASIEEAVEYWKMVYFDIIDLQALIDRIGTVLHSSESILAEDLRDAQVTERTYLALERERRMIRRCRDAADGFVESFVSRLRSEPLEKPWSASLSAIDIDYEGLWKDLRGGNKDINIKHIGDEVSFSRFQESIRFANFKDVYISAEGLVEVYKKKSGSTGCIKLMIRGLGKLLGDEWYNEAAESIGTTKKAIDKLNVSQPAKELLNMVLKKRIPYFAY